MKENENDREEEIISPISTSRKKQETNFPTFLWSWVTREGQLFAQYLLFLSFFFLLFSRFPKRPSKCLSNIHLVWSQENKIRHFAQWGQFKKYQNISTHKERTRKYRVN